MMLRILLAFWLLFSSLGHHPEAMTAAAMKSGILLRMHVIAQDDSDEMQRVKLAVRDAVQLAYANAPVEGTMLARTEALLPQLVLAAEGAAQAEGFPGEVAVSIEELHFDARTIDGLTIPAGTYPALMIRLGDARGHNWWGLIDPQLSMACADYQKDAPWDWSWLGFLRALLCFEWRGCP